MTVCWTSFPDSGSFCAGFSSRCSRILSPLTTRDVLAVTATANATLQISSSADVMAVKFNVVSGKTLTLTGAANLKAARIRVYGGGKPRRPRSGRAHERSEVAARSRAERTEAGLGRRPT